MQQNNPSKLWLNIGSALAGLASLVAFFFLPWLTVGTPTPIPIIDLHFDMDARFLADISSLLPGDFLFALWLLPVAGIVLCGVGLFSLSPRSTGNGIPVGVVMIACSIGLLIAVLSVLHTYYFLLNQLRSVVPFSDVIPFEAFFFPTIGVYVTGFCFLVALLAGIVNLRSSGGRENGEPDI